MHTFYDNAKNSIGFFIRIKLFIFMNSLLKKIDFIVNSGFIDLN